MRTSQYHDSVREMLTALELGPQGQVMWFGVRQAEARRSVYRTWDVETKRQHLVAVLSTLLYRDFYCPGVPTPSDRARAAIPMPVQCHFLGLLSEANAGTGTTQKGWHLVRGSDDTRLFVENGSATLGVTRDEFQLSQPDQPLQPGTEVELKLAKGTMSASPGHYIAFGDKPLSGLQEPIVRIYINITAEGAPVVMRMLTTKLNRHGLAFHFKVPSMPSDYNRRDSGVLYILSADYPHVARLLPSVYIGWVDYLADGCPAFTKCLAPGIGVAEDPGTEESFGQSRCGLIASAIASTVSARGSKPATDALLLAIETEFGNHGLNLDRPYLCRNSIDQYPPLSGLRVFREKPVKKVSKHATSYQEVAVRIAEKLSRKAIWYRDLCTWLASELDESENDKERFEFVCRSVGPDLYAGTAGIAMFLADAYMATGDARFKTTARGALRHALLHCDKLVERNCFGLYTGVAGVALAAARIGILFGDTQVVDNASALTNMLMTKQQHTPAEFDLMSGSAGLICAFLALKGLLGREDLIRPAMALGDALLESANRSSRGWMWSGPAASNRPGLTGLSHGTSGVACALVELFRESDVTRYRDGAGKAFQYERSWFDVKHGNWPHLDEADSAVQRMNAPRPFVSHWCHGGPGIAHSRLRAWRILGDEQLAEEAEVGIRATAVQLKSWLAAPEEANFSLCHGFAGNAAILLNASTGGACEARRRIVHEVAGVGIAKYSDPDREWPCGGGAGEHPGLMLGLAGIGSFYLGLSCGKAPAALLVSPDAFLQ